MGIAIAIFLVLLTIALWFAVVKGRISDVSLARLSGIGGFVSLVAAIIIIWVTLPPQSETGALSTATLAPIKSAPPPASNNSSPTASLQATFAPGTPTLLPSSPTPSPVTNPYFLPDCIPLDKWSSTYLPFGYMPSRGPCFPLSTLGFTSDFDRLIITVDHSPSTTDQVANIYTSLPKSGLIAFKLRVDKLSTESRYDESNLILGFVDIDQLPIRKPENQTPGAYFGRLIYISALEHTSPVILLEDWLPSNAPPPSPLPRTFDFFALGTTVTVTFNFNEYESKVVIGENPAFSRTLDISGLDPNYRVFWIGYATSETGTIRAEILNFTIEQP